MTRVLDFGGNRVEKVREGLLRDLLDGSLRVGTKLPNEQGLATRFGVSRSSVREAVSALASAGYLERRHGSGTYVVGVPGPRHALDATISYTHMIADAGMRPGVQILSSTTRPATHDEARDFDLEDDALVRCLERLRTADGRAVIYSLDVLPETLLAGVSEKALTRSLYDVLERIGHRVVSANAVLLPVVADENLAGLLDVDVGSPLQQISEIDFTRQGHAVILSTEWHVPGVFELRVNRRP